MVGSRTNGSNGAIAAHEKDAEPAIHELPKGVNHQGKTHVTSQINALGRTEPPTLLYE